MSNWEEKINNAFQFLPEDPVDRVDKIEPEGLGYIGRAKIRMASDGKYEGALGINNIYGVFPVGISELFNIALISKTLKEAAILKLKDKITEACIGMELMQASKNLNRKDHLDNLVNDNWGTMNPENLFVLSILTSGLHKERRCNKKLHALFIGTGSGYPEVTCYKLCLNNSSASNLHIDTVDLRKHLSGETLYAPFTYPLDGRNHTYGPVADINIGHCIHDAIDKKEIKKDAFNFIHSDSLSYLKAQEEKEIWDFIVIDGNHLYEAVYSDLSESFKRLKKGGFIFLDDYGANKTATNPGVTAATFTFAHQNKLIGYWVANPKDPFVTNSAFLIK